MVLHFSLSLLSDIFVASPSLLLGVPVFQETSLKLDVQTINVIAKQQQKTIRPGTISICLRQSKRNRVK